MVANGIRGVSSHLGASVARDPLLPRQDDVAPPPPLQQQRLQPPREAGNGQQVDAGGGGSFPWLTVAGFLYLTFSSVMALHRCWPNRGDAAFVVSAYADLLLLFYCLRRYERAEPGSSLREWLKLAVWLLTSALTLLFSYKVAAVMPAAVAAVVWVMGLATISGGFLAFFCFQKTT